jgi:hypothetical protein
MKATSAVSPTGFGPEEGRTTRWIALSVAIDRRNVNWVVDADIQNFFGAVSQEWLIRFVKHRVGDERITRLIARIGLAGICAGGARQRASLSRLAIFLVGCPVPAHELAGATPPLHSGDRD